MNRRAFLQQSSLLSTASLLPMSPFATSTKPTYKLGLQLFSINQDMNEGPFGTLKKVQAMGYEDFEIYGFDPEKGTYYGHPAADFKQVLDDMNLTVTSGHYGFSDYLHQSFDQLRWFVDQCIAGAKALNCPYITWPWLAPEFRTPANFSLLADRLNRIGEQVNAAGLGFAYHNHGFEFDDHNGQTGYEIILQDTDPELVKLQMDFYWVMHSSKLTPKEWIAKHPGRVVMWHIKDMDKLTRDYTELGNGSIDYLDILPDPEASGLEYYYIEQGGNFANSPLQSAATSADYFKKNLQHLL
ncbi:MAG: sugar phosphate isomerase/epimerase [Bacteroidota bacterium]